MNKRISSIIERQLRNYTKNLAKLAEMEADLNSMNVDYELVLRVQTSVTDGNDGLCNTLDQVDEMREWLETINYYLNNESEIGYIMQHRYIHGLEIADICDLYPMVRQTYYDYQTKFFEQIESDAAHKRLIKLEDIRG